MQCIEIVIYLLEVRHAIIYTRWTHTVVKLVRVYFVSDYKILLFMLGVEDLLHIYLPCVLFAGHWQTVQNQIRHRNPYTPCVLFMGHRQIVQDVASDQGLHCLLTKCTFTFGRNC